MSESNRTWDLVPKHHKQACLEEIIHFFENERDEEIGILAAQEVLDFFQQTVGPHIYNAGVTDAKRVFAERSEDIGVDFDLLLRNS